MSCPGENYVVPGANPCNQSGGVQSVSAGTNVTITGTPTVPIVNASGVVQSVAAGTGVTITGTSTVPIVNVTSSAQSQAFGNNTLSVGGLTTTPTQLSAVGFTTSSTSDIFASATVTFTTSSNTKYDTSFNLTIDGVTMSTGTFNDSIDGIGHFRTITVTGFRASLASGIHTLRLVGSTSAPNGIITLTRITTSGLANLL